MLIVTLIGGLGNQMFQYAFGLALAHRRALPVYYDITQLLDRTPREDFTFRDFELSIFTGAVPIAPAYQASLYLPAVHLPAATPINRLISGVARRLLRARVHYDKQIFKYDPTVWSTGLNTCFYGDWQCEQYFSHYENVIRHAFTFRNEPVAENKLLAEQIQTQNAVSVHIRRGDYVSIPSSPQGTCTLAYYQQAVKHISAHVEKPVLYIFSDDPDWVREHMKFEIPAVYVAHNRGSSSFEDLRLMSLCKHNIIANSSFSWWGAWLNANPGKLVIAPQQWMRTDADTTDLTPPGWIRF